MYEPGGNRIEVTSGGYLVFDPDPEGTTIWTESQYKASRAWGRAIPALVRHLCDATVWGRTRPMKQERR